MIKRFTQRCSPHVNHMELYLPVMMQLFSTYSLESTCKGLEQELRNLLLDEYLTKSTERKNTNNIN